MEAYLCQPEYVAALITCLRAVEQNNPALLADVSPALVCFPSVFVTKESVVEPSLTGIIVLSASATYLNYSDFEIFHPAGAVSYTHLTLPTNREV